MYKRNNNRTLLFYRSFRVHFNQIKNSHNNNNNTLSWLSGKLFTLLKLSNNFQVRATVRTHCTSQYRLFLPSSYMLPGSNPIKLILYTVCQVLWRDFMLIQDCIQYSNPIKYIKLRFHHRKSQYTSYKLQIWSPNIAIS